MSLSSETINNNLSARANKTGKALEEYVENVLDKNEYKKISSIAEKKEVFTKKGKWNGKYFAAQVPCGTSIYGSKRKCDFLVINQEKFPNGLIIECKWQQSAGSVDEKYPFTLLNVAKTKTPTIILLDGAGYKKTAVSWLKSNVGKDSLLGVYNMTEFQKKVNNNFF